MSEGAFIRKEADMIGSNTTVLLSSCFSQLLLLLLTDRKRAEEPTKKKKTKKKKSQGFKVDENRFSRPFHLGFSLWLLPPTKEKETTLLLPLLLLLLPSVSVCLFACFPVCLVATTMHSIWKCGIQAKGATQKNVMGRDSFDMVSCSYAIQPI